MRKTFALSAVVMILAFLLLIFGFSTPQVRHSASIGPVALLVTDDTGAYVLQIKLGAHQAALLMGGDLTIETITRESLAAAVQKWTDRKAGAVLLHLEDATLTNMAEAAFREKGIPVAAILDEDDSLPTVGADEKQAGQLLGGFAAPYQTVAVFGENKTRLEGLLAALDPARQVLYNILPSAGDNACVIALTGESTLLLAQKKRAGALPFPLAGVDPGEARVPLMAEGTVNALVFPTPYQMGYRAVEAALAGGTETHLTPCVLVPAEEMYHARHIKVMFPLLN